MAEKEEMTIEKQLDEICKWLHANSERIKKAELSVLFTRIRKGTVDEDGIGGECSTAFTGTFAGAVVAAGSVIESFYELDLTDRQDKILTINMLSVINNHVDKLKQERGESDND